MSPSSICNLVFFISCFPFKIILTLSQVAFGGGNSLKVIFSVSKPTASSLSISWKTAVSVEVIVHDHSEAFAGPLSASCFNSHRVSPPSPLSTDTEYKTLDTFVA